MDVKKIYPVPENFARDAYINQEEYKALYQQSIEDPETFWKKQAVDLISWLKPFEKVTAGDFNKLNMRWFINGKLNASYNCLDRHLESKKNQVAIIWQGDDPSEIKKVTYQELYEQVNRFANVLKNYGIKKGDRVCIYLPMIPEIAIAMLACARIGAIHSIVFSAFSPDSLKTRILDADCSLLITADEGIRAGQTNGLKINADKAALDCPKIKNIIVVQRTGNSIPWNKTRDVWYHKEMQKASAYCPIEEMDSDDPLFILYTSGSTGKPKGVMHATGGYLVYIAITFKLIFNYHDKDVFWCTADVGWITGHSYVLYGPLLNGGTTLLFEGVPHYPNFSRYWEIVDQHQVNIFYTAPTGLRSIRREGDEWIKKSSRKSLKLLGSVGEPINPEVWEWYYNVIGEKRCPIVDTWWQTETGGALISPLPGAVPMKPGSATLPFFGIKPEVVDEKGEPVQDGKLGKLIIKNPWPGLMKTIYGNNNLFINTYFKEFPGNYLTGDDAYRDQDGYYWILGRDDDVIKVSGHRLGTGEIESALISHADVSEAAVVAVPHEIKGNTIYAYVTTKSGVNHTDNLKKELIKKVRNDIGPIAIIETVQWTEDLPKTRSGKIMRRILRKIANNQFEDLGDISTLSNGAVVKDIIEERKKDST